MSKKILNNFFTHLLCFSYVTQISFENIQLVHFLFFTYTVCLLYRRIIYFDIILFILTLSLIFFATISILLSQEKISERIFISYLYLTSIFIFSIKFKEIINSNIIRIYINYAVGYAIVIIISFLFIWMANGDEHLLNWKDKKWGEFFYNFPSSFIIVYIPAIIILLDRKNLIKKILIFTSIILTLSRVGIILSLILSIKKRRLFLIFILSTSLLILLVVINDSSSVLQSNLTRINDRFDIIIYSYDFIAHYFWFGSGGRSLDVLSLVHNFDYKPIMPWPHTHNVILEFLIRYGFFTTTLLILIFIFLIFKVSGYGAFIIFIILGVSLFQSYFFEFTYLLTILILKNYFLKQEISNKNI